MTDLKRLQRWIKQQIDTCEYNIREFSYESHNVSHWKAQISAYNTVLIKLELMLNEEV